MDDRLFQDIYMLYRDLSYFTYDSVFMYDKSIRGKCTISVKELSPTGYITISKTFSYPLYGNEIDFLKRLKKYLEICKKNNLINSKKYSVTIKGHYPEIIDEEGQIFTYDELEKEYNENVSTTRNKLRESIININSVSASIIRNKHRIKDYERNYAALSQLLKAKKEESKTLFGRLSIYLKKIKRNLGFTIMTYFDEEKIDALDMKLTDEEIEKLQKSVIEDSKRLDFTSLDISKMDAVALSRFSKFFSLLDSSLGRYNDKLEEHLKTVSDAYNKLEDKVRLVNTSKSLRDIPSILNSIEFVEQPNFEEKPEKQYVVMPDAHFSPKNRSKEPKKESLIEIQRRQAELLTDREKTAIMLYKTQLYRAINSVKKYLRDNNLKLEDIKDTKVFDDLIRTGFNEYKIQIREAVSNRFFSPFGGKAKEATTRADSKFKKFKPYLDGVATEEELFEEYRGLVLESLGELDSALSKCRTTEDLVLYRGIGNASYVFDAPILSTTTDPYKALFIARIRSDGVSPRVIAEIKVPKGTPVIFITREIWDGVEDENFPFPDEQKEVILDSSKFTYEFEQSYEATLGDKTSSEKIVFNKVKLRNNKAKKAMEIPEQDEVLVR